MLVCPVTVSRRAPRPPTVNLVDMPVVAGTAIVQGALAPLGAYMHGEINPGVAGAKDNPISCPWTTTLLPSTFSRLSPEISRNRPSWVHLMMPPTTTIEAIVHPLAHAHLATCHRQRPPTRLQLDLVSLHRDLGPGAVLDLQFIVGAHIAGTSAQVRQQPFTNGEA